MEKGKQNFNLFYKAQVRVLLVKMSFISRVFFKGLFTLIPILLTIFLLVWMASSAEWAFGEPLRALPFYFPGLGVTIALIAVFVVGLMVNNYLTHKAIELLQSLLERVPIIKSIYGPLRDVTQLFARDGGTNQNQRVVLVQMGAVELLGLVTRDKFGDLPKGMAKDGEHVAVFLPLSYGVGGITVLVPKNHTRETDLPAEKALQLAITGWIKG